MKVIYSFGRLVVIKNESELGIDGQPSSILRIFIITNHNKKYQLVEFGNCWEVKGWSDDINGKWTFNRGVLCINNEWWPAVYYHKDLPELIQYLENNFPNNGVRFP